MGNLFDLNNDGKIDPVEGAMRWDMIDHMMKDSDTSGGSYTGRRSGSGTCARRPFSEQDFTYGIINRALRKDADPEVREKALKKCEDAMKQELPVCPKRQFSKWYVIGIAIGVGQLALWAVLKNPVYLIGAPVLAWFFSLPAEYDYSREKERYQWEMDARSKSQAYAKKYAEKIRKLIAEDQSGADKVQQRKMFGW